MSDEPEPHPEPHPDPAPPAPSPDNTRWTGAKAMAFLKALAQHGKVARAARSVGMSRQAAYRLRARAPNFADFWDGALVEAARRKELARQARAPVHPMLARVRLPQPPRPSAPPPRAGERR
ncbi:LysR family transcriptional regulator [Erythrobacter sp. SDW2]|uniref:LysR family transcriptional regulator n=1 Tax=Erythrobacter sp. SDW2 TaxID=2907154 RepID=UPI001F325F6D|nr:LysR family transcriptional regulator [Erythrobacter sp. SDW2]UIP07725.1 LysR family transcriptional regulator [Erythrobacter sp. SDW2]